MRQVEQMKARKLLCCEVQGKVGEGKRFSGAKVALDCESTHSKRISRIAQDASKSRMLHR